MKRLREVIKAARIELMRVPVAPRSSGPKPSINAEARRRIKAFLKKVELLQKEFGVEIGCEDGIIGLRDMRRTDDWEGYGDWDAEIFAANQSFGRFRARNVVFEDFKGWNQ